jgi:hypothetical protein
VEDRGAPCAVCDTGGRGFESRRRRVLKCLQTDSSRFLIGRGGCDLGQQARARTRSRAPDPTDKIQWHVAQVVDDADRPRISGRHIAGRRRLSGRTGQGRRIGGLARARPAGLTTYNRRATGSDDRHPHGRSIECKRRTSVDRPARRRPRDPKLAHQVLLALFANRRVAAVSFRRVGRVAVVVWGHR